MIKNILFSVFIAVSVALTAQTPIMITSSDMPDADDSIHISIVDANDFINVPNPGLTGAGYTWDYTMLSPNVQMYEKYDSPLDFPSIYAFLFNPLNTSYGKDNYEFSEIPLPGATLSAAYDFYKESSSQLKQIGAGYIINNIPIPFMYQEDDIIYEFPMNYLSTSSCFYKYGLEIPDQGYYGQSGTRSNLVDGWGTLTTPFGTFQTLRVKSTIDAVDTIYNSNFSAGTNIPRPLKYEYKWLANGMKIPVLKIETTVIAGNENISNVRYIDSTRSGVPQVGIAEPAGFYLNSTVYPNPCSNELTVSYQLPTAVQVKIIMTDVVGKTIAIPVNEVQTGGSHKLTLHTIDLIPGVYFMNLNAGNHKEIRKVIIAH